MIIMIVWAHLRDSDFTSLRVLAFWRPGTVFQTFAMRLDGKVGKPGTGNEMLDDSADLVW